MLVCEGAARCDASSVVSGKEKEMKEKKDCGLFPGSLKDDSVDSVPSSNPVQFFYLKSTFDCFKFIFFYD